MERAQGGGRGGPGSTLPEGPGNEQDACCPALAVAFTRDPCLPRRPFVPGGRRLRPCFSRLSLESDTATVNRKRTIQN